MAFPRHLMQSLEMPAVTQIRASDDHVPCESYIPLQYRIGLSSMFTWALGVAPFKDNAWSTSHQPGGSCGNSNETSPGLHLAISVFSAGPVTPADGVGYSDVNQIMRTCTTGGLILAPSRAATALDAQVLSHAFSGAQYTRGEVYAAYSYISGWAWDHILAADLNASFAVTPTALAGIRSDVHLRHGAPVGGSRYAVRPLPIVPAVSLHAGAPPAALAYTLDTSTLDLATLVVQPFGAGSPINLAPCAETDFAVWHIAPVFANGWALLGELGKWIPTAEARMSDVTASDHDLTVELSGEPGEVLPITFYNTAAANATTVTCTVDDSGRVRIVMPFGVCQ